MPANLTLSPVSHSSLARAAVAEVRSARTEKKADAAEQFEAFVLQSFVQDMLPKDANSVFGGGIAGDYWKSMLAEQLGAVMAKSGDIGIARYVREGAEGGLRAGTGPSSGGAAHAASALLDGVNPAKLGE